MCSTCCTQCFSGKSRRAARKRGQCTLGVPWRRRRRRQWLAWPTTPGPNWRGSPCPSPRQAAATMTQAAEARERDAQKAYWKEHSGEATVEAMMLDSHAAEIDKLERPEVGPGRGWRVPAARWCASRAIDAITAAAGTCWQPDAPRRPAIKHICRADRAVPAPRLPCRCSSCWDRWRGCGSWSWARGSAGSPCRRCRRLPPLPPKSCCCSPQQRPAAR